jgi:hypothetical protein
MTRTLYYQAHLSSPPQHYLRQPRHAKASFVDFDFVDCGKCAAKAAHKSPYRRAKSDSTPQVAVVIGSPSSSNWACDVEKLRKSSGLLHTTTMRPKMGAFQGGPFRVVDRSIESHALLLRADAINGHWDFRLSPLMAQEMKTLDTVTVHTISHSPHR